MSELLGLLALGLVAVYGLLMLALLYGIFYRIGVTNVILCERLDEDDGASDAPEAVVDEASPARK